MANDQTNPNDPMTKQKFYSLVRYDWTFGLWSLIGHCVLDIGHF